MPPITLAPHAAPRKLEAEVTPRALTLRDIAAILEQLERDHDTIIAKAFAQALDYDWLTELARVGGAHNDPSCIDPRFLVLWGMRGSAVEQFQWALNQLGHACPTSGLFDDATLRAYDAWLADPNRAAHAEIEVDWGDVETERFK